MFPLYLNSLLLLSVLLIIIIPLAYTKEGKNYVNILFFIVIISTTIIRPYILGIDNLQYSLILTDPSSWDGGNFKFGLIYLLSYPIPGTWQKIFMLNILSTITSSYFIKKGLGRFNINKQNTSPYYKIILLSYFVIIISPLALIHFRQNISLAFISILIFSDFNITNTKDKLKISLLYLIILGIHPVYLPYLIIDFISKNISSINRIINRVTVFSRYILFTILSSLTILILGLSNYIYLYFTSILPGFSSYGIQLSSEIAIPSFRNISLLYTIVLLIPIILYRFLSKRTKETNNNEIWIKILIYSLFAFMFMVIEYKLADMYSIGRVKSSIYPALLILIKDCQNIKLSKQNGLIVASLSIMLASISYINLSTRIINTY